MKTVERRQIHDFEQHFQCETEALPQTPGVVGDCIVVQRDGPDDIVSVGQRIEFKYDRASTRTGNLFIEFRQTSDEWRSYRVSGCRKAILEGCLLVIQTGSTYLVFDNVSYDELIQKSVCTCETRTGANHNRIGQFAEGYIVPTTAAYQCCSYAYSSKTEKNQL